MSEPTLPEVNSTPAACRNNLRRTGQTRAFLRRHRKGFVGIALLAATLFVFMGGVYWDVRREGRPIYADPASAPNLSVAIVFGAGYGKKGPSAMLYDRVATGVRLYQLGKVRKLLMTGDNGRANYNEPAIMRKTALALGVPDRDIVQDFAGFRTYDSLYRARDIFGIRSAILVTQSYHLPRALFTARALGMETIGVAADRGYYPGQVWRDLREIGSVENAWLSARILHPRPTFLGKAEPIFPAGLPPL